MAELALPSPTPDRSVTVALIGDTHLPRGDRQIPRPCLEACEAADLICHVGDVTTAWELTALEALGPPVAAVFGNIDEPELQASLPERRVVRIGAVVIGLVHIPGPRKGRTDRLAGWFPDADLVVYGHTHVPEQRTMTRGNGTRSGRDDDRLLVICNPGSPTERRRSPRHSFAVATITPDRLEVEHVDAASGERFDPGPA